MSSPGHVASAVSEGEVLRFARKHQAIGITGAGAISAGQVQVSFLSPKLGAEFPLLAKCRA